MFPADSKYAHPPSSQEETAKCGKEIPDGRSARKLRHLGGRAIHSFDLISDGDVIAVGVSGGKDSLVLAAFLSDLRRRAPVDFKLGAIHLGADGDGRLKGWLQGLGLDFIHTDDTPEVEEIAFWRPGGPSPCFACSRVRRNRLFSICRDLGINRLALGHHLDDAIETMLMNIFHSGRVHGLQARQDLFEGRLSIIRPLFLTPESLIIRLAAEWSLPVVPKTCPADGHTTRQEIKELVAGVCARHPKTYGNLSASVTALAEPVNG